MPDRKEQRWPLNILEKKEHDMLNSIFRAILIGRARSAAQRTVAHMSARQLNDIGYSKWVFVEDAVSKTIRDLDEVDEHRRQKAITPASTFSLSSLWALFMRRTAN